MMAHSNASVISCAFNSTTYRLAEAKSSDMDRCLRRLDRFGAWELAKTIGDCSQKSPCLSPACPICARVEQALFADACYHLAQKRSEGIEVGFLNLLLPGHAIPVGALGGLRVESFRRQTRDALAGTDTLCAVGAIDFSVNLVAKSEQRIWWQPTAQMLIQSRDIAAVSRKLRQRFRPSEQAARPVVVRPWDGNTALFPYLLKPNFYRRTAIKTAKWNPLTETFREVSNTRKGPLRVKEELEAALFIDALGLGGRLLLRNLRLHLISGKLQLVPLPDT